MSFEIHNWLEFVQKRVGIEGIIDVQVDNVTATAGGCSAEIVRLVITASEGNRPVILKRTQPTRVESSQSLGIAREAEFFTHFAPLLDPECKFLPKVYYSAVESDGYKVVLMEDLAARHGVQSGYFFGNNSFLNHNKDLSAITAHFRGTVTERDIVIRAFELGAQLHGRFWHDETLLGIPYLRAQSWIRGEEAGEESFRSTVNFAIDAWVEFKAQHKEKATFAMDERLVQLIDTSVAKVDYKAYAESWKTRHWSMVHGDFHPANFMVVDSATVGQQKFDLIMLDWEAVGVGSGPQDLGQYLISHSYPQNRREVEEEALSAYHRVLNAAIAQRVGSGGAAAETVSLEYIKKEYVEGGLCRWTWLFPVCAKFCPPNSLKYFHDQMLAFMIDHNVDPTSIGMMRP